MLHVSCCNVCPPPKLGKEKEQGATGPRVSPRGSPSSERVSERASDSLQEALGAVAPHLRESETTIKIKFAFFRGGGGAGRKIVQNAIFRGKRHDNKILKVKILLSRNFVVMAQAPIIVSPLNLFQGCFGSSPKAPLRQGTLKRHPQLECRKWGFKR